MDQLEGNSPSGKILSPGPPKSSIHLIRVIRGIRMNRRTRLPAPEPRVLTYGFFSVAVTTRTCIPSSMFALGFVTMVEPSAMPERISMLEP
jgi:hypothetical protein